MHTSRSVGARLAQTACSVFLLGTLLMTSACGGDPHVQQQASQGQSQLDSLLKQAQTIGVPSSLLQPIIKQEHQLSSSSAPFSLFNDQPVNDYYHNLSTRYTGLEVQVQGLITSSTEQFQAQAQQDMKKFQVALAQRRSQNLPVQNFSKQFDSDQTLMALAQYPKDYAAISTNAHIATQGLDLMLAASDQLNTFKDTISQMQGAHLDVTTLQTQYQNDQQALASAILPDEFTKLNTLINAQYQQAVVNSTQALPYVTAAKLSDFANQIKLLQTYNIKTDAYQKKLDADRATMGKTLSIKDYAAFAQQVDADMATMHDDLIKGQAHYLVQQFHQEATNWGNAHKYHDNYNGQDYILNAGYSMTGIGGDIDLHLSWASTTDDFQGIVDEANDDLFNLHMLEADYNDKTPYNQVHATDMQLLDRYKVQQGQVVIVSLVEEAMRIYQDGKLVNAFQVTTGRIELPSLPGFWPVMSRESPTTFKSPEPKGSPFWYPDTPIHFAVLYHFGGYFIHDSWWRADYGPGTQFPHADSSGDTVFSGNGSHGCINMRQDQAGWVYNNTNWKTKIVIY